MTATEDRLTAVLAERASMVREDTLRPLLVPQRTRRRWPRVLAPVAAAVAVAAVLGTEIAVEQMTGPPNPARRAVQAPFVRIGNTTGGMAYDAANGTIYVAVTRQVATHHRPEAGGKPAPAWRAAPGTLAMVNAAACNASDSRGCGHVSYAATGGQGAGYVAVDQRTHTAYVLNNWSNTIGVINTATCDARTTSGCAHNPARIRVPPGGTSLAVNPQTDTLYVGEFSEATRLSRTRAQMTVINGAACNASDSRGCDAPPAATVTLGTGRLLSPKITVDQGTNTVYATGAGTGMAVFNGRTCTGTDTGGCMAPLATIPAGIGSRALEATVDALAGTIYSSTFSGQTGGLVTVINRNTCNALDTSGCAHPATIRGGPSPEAVAADPRTHTLYVVNGASGVSMINTATCNAASVSACSQFPASFPAGPYPGQIVVSPGTQTVYVLNRQAGNLSVINAATCNATVARGCPARSPAGTVRDTPYTCDPILSRYEAGEPAGPLESASVRVASGTAGSQRWTLWARKGVADPYGIEQGGLVLNGRWYPLCDNGLSAGAGGDMHLIDAGTRGIVYGYVQHPNRVKVRLGNHSPRWTPYSTLLAGTTFFIFQLPRSACAYHGLAVNAWQGNKWSGYTNAAYGTCLPSKWVAVTVGRGTWGPDSQGRSNLHW
jgi:DNA-binding beta-propeller fold protein YncE